MILESPAFKSGDPIPSIYTCDGGDVSPPLHIREIPPDARSLVLMVDDPDAPAKVWLHWIVWNIPLGMIEMLQGTPVVGADVGMNDFGKRSYSGPCPPSGKHRYYFRLSALNTTLSLRPDAARHEVEEAMEGHILASAELMGTYTRN